MTPKRTHKHQMGTKEKKQSNHEMINHDSVTVNERRKRRKKNKTKKKKRKKNLRSKNSDKLGEKKNKQLQK